MLETVEAVVKNGQIVLREQIELTEGSRALVTILDADDNEFWLSASEDSIDRIWNNEEDDIYAELLTQ